MFQMGRYNVNFDISAILLSLVILAVYSLRKNIHNRRSFLFKAIAVCLLFSAIGQLFNGLMRNGVLDASISVKTVITILTHYAHNSLGFFFTLYLLEIIGALRGFTKKGKGLLSIPQLVLTICLLVPALRQMIFYYDQAGIYHTGILHVLLYDGLIIYYIIVGAFTLYRSRKILTRKDFLAAIGSTFGIIVSVAIGLISTYLRITVFLQTLCLLVMLICIENDSDLYDDTTGLRSRYFLWKDTQVLFNASYLSYIISIKIRNYNYYDAILGEEISEGLIKAISKYLKSQVSDDLQVYSTNRGFYCMVLFNSSLPEATATAEKIRVRFTHEWKYRDTPVSFAVQVMMASIPGQISRPEQLVAFVDKGYDESLPNDHVLNELEGVKDETRRTAVTVALRRALSHDGFEVYYQPIYDSQTKRIRSCEALVRMHDEQLGNVSPEEFIEVAEQNGLIMQIGEIVFRKVCQFLADVHPERYGLDFVEVNLSTIQCMDMSLPERFLEIMNDYHIDVNRINLEITESAIIHSEDTMLRVLKELKDLGFSFALDDFGTGNANYSYIAKYPFALIKIDKSFLWESEHNEENRVILLNMISLIQNLQRHAVVEGVETEEQKNMLIGHHVRYLQGYYFSKPVPGDALIDYLQSFNQ